MRHQYRLSNVNITCRHCLVREEVKQARDAHWYVTVAANFPE